MKKAELLSPAGAMPQLKAAIDYGADAVYCGAKKFGLRAYAGNFDAEALSEAASYAHKRGVKLYVTFNAFLYDDNMEDAAKTMEMIGKSGADAAIVSDIAAILLAKEHAPNLPIHVSTQANTLNSLSARHWYELGASRIILARELSLERISSMREKLPEDLELEAFVHGALPIREGAFFQTTFRAGMRIRAAACSPADGNTRWSRKSVRVSIFP